MKKIESVMMLMRSSLRNLKAYSSARDEFDNSIDDGTVPFLYLDANENPYDNGYNRYPDPHQRKLKARVAQLKDTDVPRIFLGNGSDEAIDLIIRAFCESGQDNVIIPAPTYGMYQVSAAINDVGIRFVTLTEEFDLDVPAIIQQVDSHTKIIFLCSPNNPSGNCLRDEKIIDILQSFNGIVVIDEAYIDFTQKASMIQKLDDFPNLIVLQTFSKAWGMAGLRLGMAFSHPQIIDLLNKIKPPYNINQATQEIAWKMLESPEKKDASVKEMILERDQLAKSLAALPTVKKVFPSDANFLLVRIERASDVYQQLITNRVVVRDRSNIVLCDDCLRITVGTPAENQQLITVLRNL